MNTTVTSYNSHLYTTVIYNQTNQKTLKIQNECGHISYSLVCRYHLLAKIDTGSERETCRHIVETTLLEDKNYQFGETKVFFRLGEVAILEHARDAVRGAAVVLMQATVRRWICQRQYLRMKVAARTIQCGWFPAFALLGC